MEEKNKGVAKPDDKEFVPKNETTQNLPNPLPFPWPTSTQAYHNFGSAATSGVNPANSFFCSPWLASQMWNRQMPILYGPVYHRSFYSNFYPMAAAGVGQSSLLASSADRIQRTSAEKNMNLMGNGLQSQDSRPSIPVNKILHANATSNVTQESKEIGKRPSILVNHKSLQQPPSKETQESKEIGKRSSVLVHNKSLQPTRSKVTEESKENGKMPSIQKTNGEGLTRSVVSKSKVTTVVGQDVNNAAGGSTKIKIKLQDFPSARKQQPRMMLGNGRGAQTLTSNENCKTVHVKRNIATDQFEANPTQLNQTLSIDPKASGNNSQLENEESDETKEKRKRVEAMKISSKRKKRKTMRLHDIPTTKQEQSSMMMPGNGGAAQYMTRNAVRENRNIASDHFEAIPTKPNQRLSTEPNTSRNNPKLKKKESDEERQKRRKQAKKISSKRSRIKIKKEREEIIDSLEILDAENDALSKELRDRTNECEKITEENNALLKELIEEYGEDTIMNLLGEQSTDSVSAGGQSSNNS